MRHAARALLWATLAAAATVLAVLGSALLALVSVGVFATSGPAWTVGVPVAGATVRLNVVGVVRLATVPGVARLLDGKALRTRHGPVTFGRANDGLRIRCEPCLVQHADLAAAPVRLRSVVLDVTRVDDRLDGQLAAEGARLAFTARLRAGAIDVDWRLPPTDLARLYPVLGDAVPEATYARLEGTVRAEGRLSLPSKRSRIHWSADRLEVGGLGTEPLQYGWFRFACPSGDGGTRLVISGDGERGWIAADAMGPYLAAAVVAAEDQRFHRHAGYDEAAIAAILGDVEQGRPSRGASTLTQQLARTLFTGGERTAARKLRELLYAIEMERTLGKARILELYLNTVHWGPGVCGAKAAARAYFNKPPSRLSAIESAWLASVLRNPQRAWEDEFAARRPDPTRALRIVNEMRNWPVRERRRFSTQPLAFATGPRATRR